MDKEEHDTAASVDATLEDSRRWVDDPKERWVGRRNGVGSFFVGIGKLPGSRFLVGCVTS